MGICDGVAEGDAPRDSEGVGEGVLLSEGVGSGGASEAVGVVLGVTDAVEEADAVDEGDGKDDAVLADLADMKAEADVAADAVGDPEAVAHVLGPTLTPDETLTVNELCAEGVAAGEAVDDPVLVALGVFAAEGVRLRTGEADDVTDGRLERVTDDEAVAVRERDEDFVDDALAVIVKLTAEERDADAEPERVVHELDEPDRRAEAEPVALAVSVEDAHAESDADTDGVSERVSEDMADEHAETDGERDTDDALDAEELRDAVGVRDWVVETDSERSPETLAATGDVLRPGDRVAGIDAVLVTELDACRDAVVDAETLSVAVAHCDTLGDSDDEELPESECTLEPDAGVAGDSDDERDSEWAAEPVEHTVDERDAAAESDSDGEPEADRDASGDAEVDTVRDALLLALTVEDNRVEGDDSAEKEGLEDEDRVGDSGAVGDTDSVGKRDTAGGSVPVAEGVAKTDADKGVLEAHSVGASVPLALTLDEKLMDVVIVYLANVARCVAL